MIPGGKSMKNLYLIRHGETLFNQRRKIQGWCDSPLTEKGIQQATQAKVLLSKIDFDHCYSSTAERCCDTLEIISDLPYQRLKGLKERNFGIFEAESEDLNPPIEKYDEFFPIYGGETKKQVQDRMVKTLTDIMNKPDHQTVLAVSHAGACRCFLSHLGNPEELLNGNKFSNCCILHFQFDHNEFKFIEVLNI